LQQVAFRPDFRILLKFINMWLIKHLLLRPLSVCYCVITSLRNYLFDKGVLKTQSFPFPVICVGNITVGGTGKTPHVEYIAGLLSKSVKTAVVSRGYMRSGKGFRIVNPSDNADLTGDEPLQIASGLPHVTVAVDADRAEGIRKILEIDPGIHSVILDDGFQHRSVKAGLNILLTDYGRLMTRDCLLPLGRLRESLRGSSRAEVIIVTKTPADITSVKITELKKEISPLPRQSFFMTTFEYGDLKTVFDIEKEKSPTHRKISPGTGVLLVTGIANPEPLLNYIRLTTENITNIAYSDHHKFSISDIEHIREAYESIKQEDKLIVTTEKDAVRLKEFTNIAIPFKNDFYFIPIKVKFIEDEEKFIKIVTDYAGKIT
jgi:tetraacyldisaccharide 4'-kinase